MIKREQKAKRLSLKWRAVAMLAALFMAPVFAQDEPIVEEPLPGEELLMPPEVPQMPGTIEGTGTYFEVTDSEYLNIALASSEPVHLTLESVPQMVVIHIEAAEGASTTLITMAGFAPSTTYYKYQDDYHNEEAFTTDAGGNYSFSQDLTIPHLVFIQPNAGTIFLSNTGWSKPVGTWDPGTKTGTLTQNVAETIQINSNAITLDGAGHTVAGAGSGNGVYLSGRTGVTIKNLTVTSLTYGIYLYNSSYNTLTSNSTCNNGSGIFLRVSGYNTLTGNTASLNRDYGIYLYNNSSNNALTGNTASQNYYGICLYSSTGNTLTENTASSNNDGIYLQDYSNNNTLTENTATMNSRYGIYLYNSGNSTLTGNTMSGNNYNFSVSGSSDLDFDNTIDPTNTVDGKPVYYVKNVSNYEYGSSTNAGVFYAVKCDNITIKDLTLTKNGPGIYLWKTNNSRIENVVTSENGSGIYLSNSSNNTLTGNTASLNRDYGIYLYNSSNNTLTANTTSDNMYGIVLSYSSNNNTLRGNIASENHYGIYLYTSGNSTLTGNTMSGNDYNFSLSYNWSQDVYFDNTIDVTNTVDGKPFYYVKNVTGQVYDASTNAGVFYAIKCNNITIKDLTPTKNWAGVFLWQTHNSRIENVIASQNYCGIYLDLSSGNTLTGNTASENSNGIGLDGFCNYNTLTSNTVNSNSNYGIYVSYYSSYNTLRGNTASNNSVGVYLYASSDNTLTRNIASQNNYGIYLYWSSNRNRLIDNISSENYYYGIFLNRSNTNVLTDNTASQNYIRGIYLEVSSNNSLRGNIAFKNLYGIYLYYSSGNQVYNNNFINNTPQAYVGGGRDNVFNLAAPTGGNYWSDWDTPDGNGDGFVDYPYKFSGGQDDLPWVSRFNHPPQAMITSPTSGFVQAVNTPVKFVGQIYDPDIGDTHTAVWTVSNENWAEDYEFEGTVSGASVTGSVAFPESGIYLIKLTVTDASGASGEATTAIDEQGNEMPAFVVIYDPEGGFVTGGGWINSPAGAYTADPSLIGKATFGFVSKYQKGATVPTGQTEFQFKVANLNFHSKTYEWLVVSGSRAQYKGSGTINGAGNYGFMLTAIDGQINGGGGADKFRMKIWDDTGVIYDNQKGESDTAEPTTIIGGGSIVIHKN